MVVLWLLPLRQHGIDYFYSDTHSNLWSANALHYCDPRWHRVDSQIKRPKVDASDSPEQLGQERLLLSIGLLGAPTPPVRALRGDTAPSTLVMVAVCVLLLLVLVQVMRVVVRRRMRVRMQVRRHRGIIKRIDFDPAMIVLFRTVGVHAVIDRLSSISTETDAKGRCERQRSLCWRGRRHRVVQCPCDRRCGMDSGGSVRLCGWVRQRKGPVK